MSREYHYFISYLCETGFGNASIVFKKKIEQFKDIIEIQDYLNKKKENKNTIIMNYILLQESEVKDE